MNNRKSINLGMSYEKSINLGVSYESQNSYFMDTPVSPKTLEEDSTEHPKVKIQIQFVENVQTVAEDFDQLKRMPDTLKDSFQEYFLRHYANLNANEKAVPGKTFGNSLGSFSMTSGGKNSHLLSPGYLSPGLAGEGGLGGGATTPTSVASTAIFEFDPETLPKSIANRKVKETFFQTRDKSGSINMVYDFHNEVLYTPSNAGSVFEFDPETLPKSIANRKPGNNNYEPSPNKYEHLLKSPDSENGDVFKTGFRWTPSVETGQGGLLLAESELLTPQNQKESNFYSIMEDSSEYNSHDSENDISENTNSTRTTT
eukprot:UN27480